ncbi:MAG TPA: hypothetical protein VKE94_08525 [Gemmataceae bacterium]|nr:hypothetical protein [Gemmataceae bacterium]
MFLVEIITEEGYWSGTATWDTLELAQEVAEGLRAMLAADC